MARSLAALAALLALAACTERSSDEHDAGGVDTGVVIEIDAGPQCENGVRDGDESHVDCGGDSCDPCADGSNCLRASDCRSSVCARGYCLVPSCDDDVRNGDETGTDCGGDCGLCPGGQPCASNADCVSGRCVASTCDASSCEDGRRNDDETDVDCGGPTCPRCEGDRACIGDEDCESLICAAATCTRPTCTDRVQNQDETSLDCGGAVCPPCRDGLACGVDADCLGMRCLAGACVSCEDMIHNAEETDVDCGGSLCAPCRDGLMCVSGSDCASGQCRGGTCISCVDRTLNGDETDVDCGGGTCPGCGTALMCLGNSDCLSNDCVGGMCRGAGDRCDNPWELHAGSNTVAWVATGADYMGLRPSCALADSTGPDIVMSYTATVNGVLSYDIVKPTATRWTLVVSTGPCGTLTPEVQCSPEYSLAFMRGQFTVTAGTTYYFYLTDTISGTMPLSNPLSVTISEVVPPCSPGVGGVVGTAITRIPMSPSFITEYYVAADANPAGYVYVGGLSYLYRVPKAGGPTEDVELLASISTPLGYEMAIAGDEVFVFDTLTTGTTNRVFRITSDGGATWHTGGQNYATFPVAPNDDFRGAAAHGGTLYMITHDSLLDAEIWSVPTGAATMPVVGTLLGTIPFRNCTGLAADSTYLYTACQTSQQIVRVNRTTLATTVIASVTGMSATRSALAAHDTSGDGVADVIYSNFIASEAVWHTCGLDGTPFSIEHVSWGTGTANYGVAFDAVGGVIYAFDDDTREVLAIR